MRKFIKTSTQKILGFVNSPDGKKSILFIFIIALQAAQAFAADASSLNSDLQGKLSPILQVLGSPWVKGVAIIALIAECIAVFTKAGHEQGIFKKFIPWIIGTLLFLSASTITSMFMNIDSTGAGFENVFNN